jgi:hypothetical protein
MLSMVAAFKVCRYFPASSSAALSSTVALLSQGISDHSLFASLAALMAWSACSALDR